MTDATAALGSNASAILEQQDDSAPPASAGEAAARARSNRHQGGPRSRRQNAGGRKGGYKPTKVELEREVKELRARLAPDGGDEEAMSPETGTEQLVGQLVGPLAQSLKTAGDMLARILHAPWWRLERSECEQLATVWSPVLAPQLARHAEKLPVLMAVGATVEILMPRVEQQLEAQRRRRLGLELTSPDEAPSEEATDDA